MTRRHTISPRRVFFDLETGGRLPWKHPITQIAAVAFDVHWQELERFEVKLKFNEADCDPESLKKHSYDRHLWAQHGVEPLTAHRRFAYFLREHATVLWHKKETSEPYHRAKLFAHKAQFDWDFLSRLNYKLRKAFPKDEHPDLDLFLPGDPRVICTMQAAQIYFDQAPPNVPRPADYQLGTLCDYFGIPFRVNQAHEALYDSLATARLYHAITAGEEQAIQLLQAA